MFVNSFMPVNLPAPILWTMAGAYGMLAIASLVTTGLTRANREANYQNLQDRIKTWWIAITLFGLAISLGHSVSVVSFGCLSFIALREYLSLIPTRLADRRVMMWAYLAIVLQYYWIHIGWYGMFLIFIPIYMFLFLPMRMVLIGETKGFLNAIGTLQWGLMLTVYTISHLCYLLMLPPAGNPVAGSTGLLVYLVFLTEMNDIAQYIVGKTCGCHPVIPKVSSGKTVEGLIGGLIVTTGLAIALAPWLTPFPPLAATALGLLLGLVGFIGDVTVSAIKRDLGIKDSGTILPGHGGILDRIDSLTYTAPVFFHFTVYFFYQGYSL